MNSSWRRGGRILLTAIAVAGIAGCRRAPRGVLLFSFDAARADHFGVYGYRRPTTPVTDRIARDGGVVFGNFISTAPWTLSSFAALFTSKYPTYCNVVGPSDGINPADPTLPELFRSAGYVTGGFVNSEFLPAKKGFARGFRLYRNFWHDPEGRVDTYADLLASVREFFHSVEEKRFFAFVHVLPPHSPYTPPAEFRPPFATPGLASSYDGATQPLKGWDLDPARASADDRQRAIDLYDANLRYGDWLLGEILRSLREAGRFDSTDVFITSDHGEAFHEHGRYFHGFTVYEEEVHVPLVFHPAADRRLHLDTATLADNVDILPTMAELEGLVMPAGHFQGVSLLDPGRARRKPFAESYAMKLAASLLRGPDFAFIRSTGSPGMYFDLSSDPLQRQNRISSVDAVALRRRGDAYERDLARRAPVSDVTIAPLDAEAVKRLASLGYVNLGPDEPRVDWPLPDGAFRASYGAVEMPRRARTGSRIKGTIEVRNDSERSFGSAGRFPVFLSYHLRDDRGAVVRFDGIRSHFGEALRPKQMRSIPFELEAPGRPGRYDVEFDIVQENVTWFSTAGSPGPHAPLQVR